MKEEKKPKRRRGPTDQLPLLTPINTTRPNGHLPATDGVSAARETDHEGMAGCGHRRKIQTSPCSSKFPTRLRSLFRLHHVDTDLCHQLCAEKAALGEQHIGPCPQHLQGRLDTKQMPQGWKQLPALGTSRQSLALLMAPVLTLNRLSFCISTQPGSVLPSPASGPNHIQVDWWQPGPQNEGTGSARTPNSRKDILVLLEPTKTDRTFQRDRVGWGTVSRRCLTGSPGGAERAVGVSPQTTPHYPQKVWERGREK